MTGKSFFPMDRVTAVRKETVSSKFKPYTCWPGTTFLETRWELARNSRMTQLKVWEEPDPDGVYILAADPAFGHDEKNNNSALQVLRVYADYIEQVAEYAWSEVRTEQFAWVIASIIGWYSNARLILELNGPGDAVWNEYKSLKQRMVSGYLRDESREVGLGKVWSNVRNYLYTRSDAMGAGSVYHWKTTTLLKVGIMERLRDFTCNGTLIIRSAEVPDEMVNITRDGDSIGAEGLRRDDRTFCLALGIRAWEQNERRMMISQGRTRDYEIARKRMNVGDQMEMMSKYQLDMFFKKKTQARKLARISELNKSWKK
jgi:Terminase RNaseH-like domain